LIAVTGLMGIDDNLRVRRARVRRTAVILGLLALAVFLWTILKHGA